MEQLMNIKTEFFQIKEVADGVYAAIVLEGKGAWGNAGIIDLGGATLVWDTFSTPAAARKLRRTAEMLLPSPIRYVVNSHWHFDHVFGNQEFADAVIVATNQTREMMAANLQITDLAQEQADWEKHLQALSEEAEHEENDRAKRALHLEVAEKQQILVALPDIRLTLPQVTFENKIRLQGTKRAVEVITYGGGHSLSDSILMLPGELVLFAGDLVFAETHPSIHKQPIEDWLTILAQIDSLNVEKLVPGHGPVGGKEHLHATAGYLSALQERVNHAKEQGVSLEELLKQQMPQDYQEWAFAHVYKWNLNNLYARERK